MLTCSDPLDLCGPKTANLEFFSKGDCMLTRASFFQGHEWLTYFGNEGLPTETRFSSADLQTIAEGNRRVDWPKELLVNMNAGVVQYASALTEYTDRPEVQRYHFLLDDRNTPAEAVADSQGELKRLTSLALENWTSDPVKALTQVGRANHLIQDSFSPAHASRDSFDPEQPWCVITVKAFIKRAGGYDTPDVEYHGGTSSDTVGHTTTQDSIYREGRDCLEPSGAKQVEACPSEPAKRAILATADYLELVQNMAVRVTAGEATAVVLGEDLPAYISEHLALCRD
ncbi:MAG: hypothetical protein AB7K71_36650 [Polyangiaceae bacterium]